MTDFWLALALLCIVESLGPLLFPQKWGRFLRSLGEMPAKELRTFGGVLFLAGVIGVLLLKS